MQLTFPWINCLLMRELPVPLALRLWDTCIAEYSSESGEGFEAFHTFVCAAILESFSKELKSRHKTDLIEFVQALPTRAWTFRDLESVISQAYVWKASFEGAG